MIITEPLRAAAAKYSLNEKLVACIVFQESGGDSEAYRFEDVFFENNLRGKTRLQLAGYVPSFPPSLSSELRARSASWGAMQVLGETGRVMGFKERWLPRLARPEFNFDIGCKYLRHLYTLSVKTVGTDPIAQETWALWKWNGSKKYPELVRQHRRDERWRIILND